MMHSMIAVIGPISVALGVVGGEQRRNTFIHNDTAHESRLWQYQSHENPRVSFHRARTK